MFTIKFNEDDLKILNDALIQMPYAKVAGLINKINEQITNQLKEIESDCAT